MKSDIQLVLVTGNKNKAREVAEITGWPVEAVALDLPEIQSLSVEEVAAAKARAAFESLQRPVIVDDTGMSIDAMKGLPGALVVWFLDSVGPDGILRMISDSDDRRASVATCIGYADATRTETFVGRVTGSIPRELRGQNGFGYDPIFIPDGQALTYAEMTADEKNRFSMRNIALAKLKSFLESDV